MLKIIQGLNVIAFNIVFIKKLFNDKKIIFSFYNFSKRKEDEMLRIQGLPVNTFFKTQQAVKKTVKSYKNAGFENIEVKSDKKGTKAVLAFDDDNKEIRRASVFYPDGRKVYKTYDIYPKKSNVNPYSKVVDTFEDSKDGCIFKKRVAMEYNHSSIPHTITKMPLDDSSCDGVEFIVSHPFEVYAKPFKRPENTEKE